jgi:hypothetical protein
VKGKLLAFVLLLGFTDSVNSSDTPEPFAVDGICGRLVSVETVAQQGPATSAREELRPLSRVRIRLFSPSIDCCALVTPVAEVTTGSDGNFQFRKPEPGDYWVAAKIDNAEYKVMVRYVGGKKGSSQCSDYLYAFEKGRLLLRRAKTATIS